jgi:hypothetical protein
MSAFYQIYPTFEIIDGYYKFAFTVVYRDLKLRKKCQTLNILSLLLGGGEQNDEADHQLAVPQQGDLPQVQ